MPKRPSFKKSFKADRVFTDRDEPRAIFSAALATSQGNEDYRVLNYYGVGGVGKTALCNQFTLSLEEKKKQNKSLSWAKLDFETSADRHAAEALLLIRVQLGQRCRIPFPTFDAAFARYFSFTRQGHDIHDECPALFKQSEMLQSIDSLLDDAAGEIPGAGFIYKYLKKLGSKTQQWWQERGNEILEDLDKLDSHKLLAMLPTYLGFDLDHWLSDEEAASQGEQRRLVVIFDTYEALWRDQATKTGIGSEHVDAWIRKLVEETPRILYVLLGRDRLNWDTDWQTVIDAHLLGGLSDNDAEQFLNTAPIVEADVRKAIIKNASGVPFYLDLQVARYESLKQPDKPLEASLFGGTEADILPRFVNHLDDQLRRTLEILSHARFIDHALTQAIATEFFGGKAEIYLQKVTRYSFWKQLDKQQWSLHGLMRDYLQAHQQQQEPELFKQVHQFLFEYYNDPLDTLQQVVDITPNHQQALLEAGYHLQQVDITAFPAWADRQGQLFYAAYAWAYVEPLWRQALAIAKQHLGKEHPDVATSLNNLAGLYQSQGDSAKAEPLFQRSLTIREKVLGVDHPHVATALNNLAMLYKSQGDSAKAEPLYQRSLTIWEKVLGVDHPHVATSLNNLAQLYQDQGDSAKAEPLFQRSLTIREKVLGVDHPHVATALNNLAVLYKAQGDSAKAEPLYLRAIAILEKAFPNGHPDLDTVNANYADMNK